MDESNIEPNDEALSQPSNVGVMPEERTSVSVPTAARRPARSRTPSTSREISRSPSVSMSPPRASTSSGGKDSPSLRPVQTRKRARKYSTPVCHEPEESPPSNRSVDISPRSTPVRGRRPTPHGPAVRHNRGRSPSSSLTRHRGRSRSLSPVREVSPSWSPSRGRRRTREHVRSDPLDINRGLRDRILDRSRSESVSLSPVPKDRKSGAHIRSSSRHLSPTRSRNYLYADDLGAHYRSRESGRYPRHRSPSPIRKRGSPPRSRRRYHSPPSQWRSRQNPDTRRHTQRSISPPASKDPRLYREHHVDDSASADRDVRTIFVWQLAQRVDEEDVFDFFSRAGRIRDVRLITDRRTRRHKGQGYVEFYHASSVQSSLALNGEPICGYPVAVKSILQEAGGTAPVLTKSASAVPVEIPLPPPPPMPSEYHDLVPKLDRDTDGAHFATNSKSFREFRSKREPMNGSMPTAKVVGARLVSIEELALLLNPHGLPVVTAPMPSVGAVKVGSLPHVGKDTSISDIKLPAAQQVPLPIPGVKNTTQFPPGAPPSSTGQFKRLYVGSVPFTVSEDDLMTIFRPFGEIVSLQLQREVVTGRSRGYGFVEFAMHESAKKALELNGLQLAGRTLKVNLASATSGPITAVSSLPQTSPVPLPGPGGHAKEFSVLTGDLAGELDDGRDGGLALNASQRALLMQRLSRGEDMGSAVTVSGTSGGKDAVPMKFSAPCQTCTSPSRCLLLSNMFDPLSELKESASFDLEVSEDVREEVSAKYGSVKHLYVDKFSHGLVYVMMGDIPASMRAKAGLHGRWFGGNRVTAEYVDELEYRKRLPEAPS